MKAMDTWNTWDVRCLNAVMKLPDMCEVRISLFDDDEKYFQEDMLWRNVQAEGNPIMDEANKNIKRFGIHHPQGKYFDLDLKYRDFVFNTEFASEKDVFVYKVTPFEGKKNIKFFVNVLFRWNAEGAVRKEKDRMIIEGSSGQYEITFAGNLDKITKINVNSQGFLFESSGPIYIRCNNFMNIEEMEEFIALRREECARELILGEGIFKECPEAIVKGVMWNTIYEPVKDRFCTPVARTWCTANGAGFGSYVLFDWDTFFCSLLSSIQDKDLAYSQVYSIMQEMTEGGMIPNFGAHRGSSVDRSQPPVGAYCVLKLYKQFVDKRLLEDNYDKLVIWNRWWMEHRDGNKDGLLEWGSDPYEIGKTLGYEANNMQGAKYESGLDNSPMYDDAAYNQESHTMELADVGLNALYAMDCWALYEIALALGRKEDAGSFKKEYERIKILINEKLWNEEAGIYCNKHWDGSFSLRLSPTNFYPMIAGVASVRQAERMVKEHLLNDKEFWGEYIIPSISRNDKAFLDNDYWRGRIWGPMNFLVSEGLKRYGLYDTSYEFSRKSLNLFMKEWKEENHLHENYNCLTGDGDDRKNADPVYTWGGLLGYIAIGELIEAQPWGALRIGNFSYDKASILNYCMGDDRLSVIKKTNGVAVKINDGDFITSDVNIIITNLSLDNAELKMDVVSITSGELIITPPDGIKEIYIAINGKVFRESNNCEKAMFKLM